MCLRVFVHRPSVESLVALGLMRNFAVHGMTQISQPSLRSLNPEPSKLKHPHTLVRSISLEPYTRDPSILEP